MTEIKPIHDRFEYRMLNCDFKSPNAIIIELNELGDNGWEVIQQLHLKNSMQILLKRKK